MREFLQAQNRERLAARRGAEVMVSSEQQVRSVIGKKPETFESFTPGCCQSPQCVRTVDPCALFKLNAARGGPLHNYVWSVGVLASA